VYLDVTSLRRPDLEARFPNIYRRLLQDGIDMATQPVPVVPAAHYLCGGVRSDLEGRTNIAGLFVSGEVACTGMHGANRLASNSLLEAVVLSRRAAGLLRADVPQRSPRHPDFAQLLPADARPPGVLVAHLRRDARQIMWDYVGIVRTNLRLEWARRNLERLRGEADLLLQDGKRTYELVELDNILVTARLMVECAIRRRESRGLHNNTDYPSLLDRAADTILDA
jgi:L-aspartate oxidase